MSDAALDNSAPADTGTTDNDSIVTNPTIDQPTPQTWPDDWRNQLVGDDSEALTQAERFKSPQDVWKSYREAQKKISSYKPSPERPGADASEQDIALYRQELGIPANHTDYDLTFEDGTVIGDDVKPMVDKYLEFAHENHLTPDQVKQNVGWFMKDMEMEQEARALANQEAKVNGIATLKAEWGPAEYEGRINSINSLFVNAPNGVSDQILGAIDENGLKIANNPDTIKWLVGLAQELNPTASLVPPGGDQQASISQEIEKIEKLMHSTDAKERDKYWKDQALQERYVKLQQAKQTV